MTILIPAWVDGRLTPVEKLSAHRRGLRHKAVSVFVLSDDKILIQRRALNKYHTPGLWANTCCTHPEWDEAPANCARRRLREELGIDGLDLRHRDKIEYRADVGGGLIEHELVDIYTAEAGPDMPLRPNPDEVMDTAWIDLPGLTDDIALRPEIYTPWLRIYLTEHRATILGEAA